MAAHKELALFDSNIYRIQCKIASARHLIPFVSFEFDPFRYALCNISDFVFFSSLNIGKDHIRITITAYFYSSPKWLYLFRFYSTFIV